MSVWNEEANRVMSERFGKDCVIALATSQDNKPYVRSVNAYYEDGKFYVITYGLSQKMMQIAKNPTVAISGEWLTVQGKAINLGYVRKSENEIIVNKLRKAFAEWIDNGHNDFDDVNTCILCIQLVKGQLYLNGICYEIHMKE